MFNPVDVFIVLGTNLLCHKKAFEVNLYAYLTQLHNINAKYIQMTSLLSVQGMFQDIHFS